MRKLFALLLLVSFFINLSNAQIADVPAPPPSSDKEMSAEQQKAYDDAMLQLNQAIQNLNQSLKKIDSVSAGGYKIDIPPIPPIPPMPEFGFSPDADVVIKIIGDSLEEFENAMEIFGDSLEVALGKKMKIEINEDGDKRVMIIENEEIDTAFDDEGCGRKKVETKMFGLDLGVSAFLQDGGSTIKAPYTPLELNLGKSINVNLHIIHQNISLIKHYASIDWGLYAELNNYRFANDSLLIPKTNEVKFFNEGYSSYKKNKLFSSYLNLPVTLRFETNPKEPKRSFNLAIGGYAGFLLGAHTKTVKQSKESNKVHDDFNLNKMHYGLTARIGYSWFDIYVTYSLTPLFNDGIAPDLTPVSAGIALVGF